MIDFSEIENYLPKYLSKEANENLFAELESFPENIDDRIYTNYLSQQQIIYQGDGISGLLTINLPDTKVNAAPGMILSNTCDLDVANERLVESRLVFATIIQLDKYKKLLLKQYVEAGKKTEESINGHIDRIKKQYISHIFYLPAGESLEHDSIVLFDRVNSLPNSIIVRDDIPQKRLFTLSNYGFYLFLYKLSIHFTRIRENVDRKGEQSPLS